MILKEIVEKLPCKVVIGKEELDQKCSGGYISDLLSDVMGHAKEGQIWLTIQTHPNVIAVALLLNLSAILFTSGTTPDKETIEKAQEERIVLLTTKKATFEAGGALYALLKG